MANYSTLISQITTAISTNGQNLITGASLQAVLLQMVSELGQAGYIFGGVANPGDSPASSDSNLFYVAASAGIYTNFNGLTVSGGELAIFTYSGGSWGKNSVTSAATPVVNDLTTGGATSALSAAMGKQIRQKVDEKTGTLALAGGIDSGDIALEGGTINGSGANTKDSTRLRFVDAVPTSRIPFLGVPSGFIIAAVFYYSVWTDSQTFTYDSYVIIGERSCEIDQTKNFARLLIKNDTGTTLTFAQVKEKLLLTSPQIDELKRDYEITRDGTLTIATKQLLDFSGKLVDTRVKSTYGSDINETVSSTGWTCFPPFYFTTPGQHIVSTNISANAYLYGYKKSGDNYVRETSQNIANNPATLASNIVAIRFECASANLADDSWLHATDENDYSIKESVIDPKLNREVARLDARIDDITPGSVPWAGKKICGIGDSIMIGCYDSGPNKGSAILDGEEGSSYGMEYNSTGGFIGALRAKYPSIDILNMGVGSTTMARNNNITPNVNYLCITDRIDNIPQNGYDYILLMGGANDFFHKDTYSVPYGTESNEEYLPLLADYDVVEGQYAAHSFRLYPYSGSGNQDLDITTFCGAMEIAIIKLMVRFKDKKLGYVIPHAIRPTNEMNAYFDYAKSLCKKYGMPCLDLRESAMMPRILSIAGNNSGSQYTFDAVHPNTLGYANRYLPAFEAWLRTL